MPQCHPKARSTRGIYGLISALFMAVGTSGCIPAGPSPEEKALIEMTVNAGVPRLGQNIYLKTIEDPTKRERILTRIAHQLSMHPDSARNLKMFLAGDGRIILIDDPRFNDVAQYGAYMNIVMIKASEDTDRMAVSASHELSHFWYGRDGLFKGLRLGGDDLATRAFTFGGFLRYNAFNEAQAVTTSIDMAFEAFLKGENGPLQSLLKQTEVMSRRYPEDMALFKPGELIYTERMTRAYLTRIYDLKNPATDIRVDDLSRTYAPERRSMAQAAAFEAWFEGKPFPSYANRYLEAYSFAVQTIGFDETVSAWVRRPLPAFDFAVKEFGAESLHERTIINGVNFSQYLMPRITTDAYLFERLDTELMDYQRKFNQSIAIYQAGQFPITMFDADQIIYSDADAKEYERYEHRKEFGIADYFSYKRQGLLPHVPAYIERDVEYLTSLKLDEYVAIQKRHPVALAELSVPNAVMPGKRDYRVAMIRAMVRNMRDGVVEAYSEGIITGLADACTQMSSQHQSDCAQSVEVILGNTIRVLGGVAPRKSSSQDLEVYKDVERTVSAYTMGLAVVLPRRSPGRPAAQPR